MVKWNQKTVKEVNQLTLLKYAMELPKVIEKVLSERGLVAYNILGSKLEVQVENGKTLAYPIPVVIAQEILKTAYDLTLEDEQQRISNLHQILWRGLIFFVHKGIFTEKKMNLLILEFMHVFEKYCEELVANLIPIK